MQWYAVVENANVQPDVLVAATLSLLATAASRSNDVYSSFTTMLNLCVEGLKTMVMRSIGENTYEVFLMTQISQQLVEKACQIWLQVAEAVEPYARTSNESITGTVYLIGIGPGGIPAVAVKLTYSGKNLSATYKTVETAEALRALVRTLLGS